MCEGTAMYPTKADGDFDMSTPEAQGAWAAAMALVLEIREEQTGPMARKVALYERTLGLAVIPALIRRAFVRLHREGFKSRGDGR